MDGRIVYCLNITGKVKIHELFSRRYLKRGYVELHLVMSKRVDVRAVCVLCAAW